MLLYAPFSQVYRQDLAVFRDAALPRQFTRSFQENTETSVIPSKMSDITTRYERLKARTTEHTNQLRDVVEKQQKFSDRTDNFGNWLQDKEGTLKSYLREPIGAEPKAVQKQIDRLKVRSSLLNQSDYSF